MIECAGKAGADGLCQNAGNSGARVTVIIVVCVGVLEAIIAVVLCCRARQKRAAKQAIPPKKPVLTLSPAAQSSVAPEAQGLETQQDKKPETPLIGLDPATSQAGGAPAHADEGHRRRRRHHGQLKRQPEVTGLTPVKLGEALE